MAFDLASKKTNFSIPLLAPAGSQMNIGLPFDVTVEVVEGQGYFIASKD